MTRDLGMDLIYLAFGAAALALFWRLPARVAILAVVFGGWVILPVADYPPVDPGVSFPWWITGLALPGEMLISKAWVIPTVALIGAVLFDPGALYRLRPAWLDIPMILWCLWPLAGGMMQGGGMPDPMLATLYLLGSWGALWVLGRLWFADADSQLLLLKACAWSGLVCLPFAVIEGFGDISLYQMVYEPHPYVTDGLERYFGHRPVGFFEHGNQYGLWVSVAALAAVWLAVAVQRSVLGFATALLALMIACAAQSVGALLLLGASLVLMIFWRLRIIWPLIVLGLATVLLAGALHLSGLVPLQWFAKQTEIGQFILSTFRSLGRGSFTWRIAQDLKAMALIDGGWLTGTMIWDWWRPAGIRPWGLWLLLVGQFGLLGFALAYGVLVTTAARGLSRLRGQRIWNRAAPAMPLALIVLVALADSLLNAFLYFPAILAAGALVRPEFAPDLEIDPNAADMTPSA